MMAAFACAKSKADVTLIEKNDICGKKLRITGKGRCNITNKCDCQEFINNVPTNGRFLYGAFTRFTSSDTISFFEDYGLEVNVERGNRVFPKSNKAIDVVNTMKLALKDVGCKIRKATAKELIIERGICKGVKLVSGKELFCDAVILATGGKSYPKTGSTGDGYDMARKCGHTIVPLRPSLIPLVAYEHWCKELQGLSLKNVSLKLFDNTTLNLVYKDFGEMIFTHFGISGPIVLSASAHMVDFDSKRYYVLIDLKPALTLEQLDKRIIKDFEKYKNKDYINSLNDLLPKKIIPVIVKLSGILPNTKCHDITKEMRLKLANIIKSLRINIKYFRPIDEAIITSGGIRVSEIDPKTMESKLIRNLYFAGELIDVDAYTGGYNLQIAFSTGALAGYSASNLGDE